jgi:hypothetical protein
MRPILTIVAASMIIFTLNAQPVKIMLVTGGHSYDTIQFFQLFDALEGIEYEHFLQPEANRKLAQGTGENYDVLVFYDMWREISLPEKQAYIDLTKKANPCFFCTMRWFRTKTGLSLKNFWAEGMWKNEAAQRKRNFQPTSTMFGFTFNPLETTRPQKVSAV